MNLVLRTHVNKTMDWETSFASGALPFQQKQPYLEILVQPQSKFRFRYRSEMTGKHGSLLGAPQQQQQQTGSMRATNILAGSLMYPAPGSSIAVTYGMLSPSDSSCCSVGSSVSVSGHVHHVEGSNAPSHTSQSQALSSNNGTKVYPTVKVSLEVNSI